jgi:formylglycine-generating enzyme required for sulfatase activity
MCYPKVADIKEGMQLPPNYLGRTGYRLPTEAEWEYACRAQALSSRSYGTAEELLGSYACYLSNARYAAEPVGLRKPNDFGLFDLYGNAWEWCHSRFLPYPRQRGVVVEDHEEAAGKLPAGQEEVRVARGGSYAHHAPVIRSAFRNRQRASEPGLTIGFRVARTYSLADD